VRNVRVILRLLVAEPHDLGRLKTGESRVSGHLYQALLAHRLRDLLALFMGALVILQKRRPYDLV
jgi:hypothetical protein